MDARSLQWSEEALLEAIGEKVDDDTLGMFPIPKTKAALREKAIKWYDDNRAILQKTICPNEKVRQYLELPEVDLLFHAICEALTVLTLGVPLGGLVSAYIIKRGIYTLCP